MRFPIIYLNMGKLMSETLPSCLIQGEQSRLFPVLSTTSREGRTTSIVLSCLSMVDDLGTSLLRSLGLKIGVRSKVDSYTEVVCKNSSSDSKNRPDGLIVVRTGSREFKALVETKIGSNDLDSEQIERYRQLAKDNEINCVITISNQFTASPSIHPLDEVNKSRSKIPVFHWSWMYILTEVDLLLGQSTTSDINQRMLLNELRRFLSHESAGVKGFHRMPKEWSDLNRLISSGGVISAKSNDASIVVKAWHQETRDITLMLSRMTGANVSEKISRKNKVDGASRAKDELNWLREKHQLRAELEIPDAAAPITVIADINRRSLDVGMTLRAPDDRVSTKARINWILRQVKTDRLEDLYLRIMWSRKVDYSQYLISDLRNNIEIALDGDNKVAPSSFHIFYSKNSGGRFAQQANFISDLEELVPAFYGEVGASLVACQKRAPKIKDDRSSVDDVTTNAISEDATDYVP